MRTATKRLIAACTSAIAMLPVTAFAASDALNRALEVGGAGGLKGQDQGDTLPAMLGKIINALLGMIGIVVIILIIYGGFMWMTAGGSEEKVSKAKKVITNAMIGLIIVFAAYAVTNFVVSSVIGAAGGAAGT